MPRADEELVYRFTELSDVAKDRVRDRYADWAGDDLVSNGEGLDTLKKLAKHFGGSIDRYSGIDWTGNSHSTVRFDMPEDYQFVDTSEAEDEDGNIDEEVLETLCRQEIQRRLDELGSYDPKTLMGHGECKLTGMCYDESAIDGFRKAFVGGESDLGTLMHEAFDSLLAASVKDYEHSVSYEGIAEDCGANDRWFDEDGTEAYAPDPQKGRYSKTRWTVMQRMTEPHGSCSAGHCAEHKQDKRVPRCALGRRPRKPPPRQKPRTGKGRK